MMIDRAERELFKEYLRNNLIPDLKREGRLGPALDLETCLQIIEEMEHNYEHHKEYAGDSSP
jgi:hypothetical protein